MKKQLLLCVMAFSCIYCASVNAQSPKVGYLTIERVLVLMPEIEGIKSEMQDFQGKINSQVQVKYESLQAKIADYETLLEGLDQETRVAREKEIQSLDRDLQKYRLDAQQATAQKENKLLGPVYERIQEAIDAVAKEHGYEQVFRAETMLYTASGDDIFELVLKQLGITLPETGN